MKSKKLIDLIKKADPTGENNVIITDSAGNWLFKPTTAWNGRYSAKRGETSLDLPLSEGEIKAGHKVLTGPGVKKVVIISIENP